MRKLFASYGRVLGTFFVSAAALWGVLLIILPQVNMLDQALRMPARQQDSAIAFALMQDARTCQTVLETYRDDSGPAEDGGLAIPSITPAPAPGEMGIPSISGGAGAALPYIIQCDRANTTRQLVRDEDVTVYLTDEYEVPALAVDLDADLETQLAQAVEIEAVVRDLHARMVADEADLNPYSLGNFAHIFQSRVIPLTEEARAAADSQLGTQLQDIFGLRFERDGQIHERITLTTLIRTIVFAVLATALALVACYPIAFNLALTATPQKAIWLFLALIIPYATVELMRIYAWVALIDANGVFNQVLGWFGVLDLAAGEAIAFKRSPITVFVVIVYTYILFMVFPLYNVMATLDRNQIEAARDLGSSTWRIHRRIIIPHTKPGIAVGCIATFMLSAGAFSVPRIISRGLQGEWFSQSIYNKFFESQNSNLGSAYAFAYTFICFVIVALFMWLVRARLRDFIRA